MMKKHKDQGIQKTSGDKSMPTFKGPRGNRKPHTAGVPSPCCGGNITPSAMGHKRPGINVNGGNVHPS